MRTHPFVSFLLIFAQIAGPTAAFANNVSPTPTTSPTGPTLTSDQSCTGMCDEMVGIIGKDFKYLKSLDGLTNWSKEDDKWCADHGVMITNPTDQDRIAPEPGATPDPIGSPNASSASPRACEEPVLPGENCNDVTFKVDRCKLQNTQSPLYCMEMFKRMEHKKWSRKLMEYNRRTMKICAAICAAGDVLTGPVVMACSASAIIDFVEELKHTAGTKQQDITIGLKHISLYPVPCVSAGVAAILYGLRKKSVDMADDAVDRACKAAKALASETQVVAGASPGVTGSGGRGRPGLLRATGGTSQNTNGSGANDDTGPLTPLAEMPPEFATALDSRFMEKTGLDKALPKNFGPIPPGSLQDSVKKDIESGLSSSGGSLPSSLAGMADTLAKAAQAGYDNEGVNSTVAGATYSGGGGGGSRGGGGPKMPDFGAMFGKGKDGDPQGGKAGTMNFKGESELDPNDIYHAKFQGSIFEIVSKKLDKNRGKVDRMEWSLPMNKALSGSNIQ